MWFVHIHTARGGLAAVPVHPQLPVHVLTPGRSPGASLLGLLGQSRPLGGKAPSARARPEPTGCELGGASGAAGAARGLCHCLRGSRLGPWGCAWGGRGCAFFCKSPATLGKAPHFWVLSFEKERYDSEMFWKGWSRKERGLCLGVLWTRPERAPPSQPLQRPVSVTQCVHPPGRREMQPAKCAGEQGRGCWPAPGVRPKGDGSPPPQRLLGEEGPVCKQAPDPQQQKEARMADPGGLFRPEHGRPDLLSVQSILGNRVPLGGRESQSSFLEPPRITEKD